MTDSWSKLVSSNFGGGDLDFDLDGVTLNTRFTRASRPSKKIVFKFHGAIDREARQLPAQQNPIKPIIPLAHQLSICDPSMTEREGFPMSWYAGHAGFDTQSHLRDFLKKVKIHLDINEAIYFGSSMGGFASLVFSYFDPGSVAVVIGPQTGVFNNHPGVVKRYLDNCWPGHSRSSVAERVNLDAMGLYKNGFKNTVIYLQSPGDIYHTRRHMAPFLSAAYENDPVENSGNVILDCRFWGKHGHGGAIPVDGYLPWLKTALLCPERDVDSLLGFYHGLVEKTSVSSPSPGRSISGNAPDPADIRRADLLRDLELRS